MVTVNSGSENTRHVTIIGAGIVGISCALNLQRDGYSVTVVDRLPPGEGTSLGNAGVIATGGVVPVPIPGLLAKIPKMLMDPLGPLSVRWSYLPKALPWLYRFMRNAAPEKVEKIANSLAMLLNSSVQEHQRLAAGTRAQSWVRPAPYIYVYKNEAAFVEDAYTWKLRRDRGVTYRELRDGEVQALVPSLSAEFRFALALDNHGYIADPMGLVQALAEHFQHSGGSILQRDVTDFDLGEKGPTRMITDDGALDLDILVIAAGAWSGKLTARLGDPVPLESERGYHVTIQNSGVELCGPVMATFGKFVATPMLPGLRLAGLVEFGGLSGPPNYSRARSLLGHAKHMFPGIDVSDFTEWMGHRPSLPDSLPVIGPSSGFPNVFYAFGHQHIGLTSGPKTGRWVADLVSGHRPNVDLSVFRVDRF